MNERECKVAAPAFRGLNEIGERDDDDDDSEQVPKGF